MTADALRLLVWSGILIAGLATCVGLRRLGLATTYVRDLLHIGAGVWAFDFRGWHSPAWPITITVTVAAFIAVLPAIAPRAGVLVAFRDSLSDSEEKWVGLTLYTFSFAAFTAIGVLGAPFAAATALVSFVLGDGLGGAIGRRFGRHFFQAPGGKRKSLEGSLAVGVFGACGVVLAAVWYGTAISPAAAVALGLLAALAEAVAPRSTDNVIVPAVVYTAIVIL